MSSKVSVGKNDNNNNIRKVLQMNLQSNASRFWLSTFPYINNLITHLSYAYLCLSFSCNKNGHSSIYRPKSCPIKYRQYLKYLHTCSIRLLFQRLKNASSDSIARSMCALPMSDFVIDVPFLVERFPLRRTYTHFATINERSKQRNIFSWESSQLIELHASIDLCFPREWT